MIGADIKALITKLNGFSTRALYEAGGLAVSRTHYEVAPEHFLLKCLEAEGSDIPLALSYLKADPIRLSASLNAALEHFSYGNTARPSFSPVLLDLLEAGWIVASLDLGLSSLRSGAILLAFLARPERYVQRGGDSGWAALSREGLAKGFFNILSASSEAQAADGEAKDGEAPAKAEGGFIERYCEDLSAKAAKGLLDPVFGRDEEIRSMINILARRRKNNPILVGEAGVGKTAVVEGLALRIKEGDVPEAFQGLRLVSLDMGLLEAGAGMKGEFERRLKGVIEEIVSYPKPIALFIDEAHTLVGAGGSAGGSDAANLMKPVLARGQMKTLAATTWKEYKKYFEKDPALARRFQPVSLEEPSPETAVLILRGLRASYEKSHGVIIRDEAIKAAAELSHRYVSGRYLPDKAVDLLDTAAARVKVGLASKPAALERAERAIQALERERSGLLRESAEGREGHSDRLSELEASLGQERAQKEELGLSCQKQRKAAQALIKAREAYLEGLGLGEGASGVSPEDASKRLGTPQEAQPEPAKEAQAQPEPAKEAQAQPEAPEEAQAQADPGGRTEPQAGEIPNPLKEAYLKALADFKALGPNLLDTEVTAEVVADVVSDWTGIPAGRLAMEEAAQIEELPKNLSERIKGQDFAIETISRVIQASKAGLRPPEQPLGVFLLVGPSGVGKTETGLVLAELLFGHSSKIVSINMSEFQERHTVSRLVGSPPGYVGYGEGGLLTEAVRQKPYSVVLLDEVEKAHLDVMNLFYQVFDKGVLTDGEGKVISFSNTIIVMASNLASDIIEGFSAQEPRPGPDKLLEAIRPTLSAHFQPALLARMTIAPYFSLSKEAIGQIAGLKLSALSERVRKNNGAALSFAPDTAQALAQLCLDSQTGARNIDHILEERLLPQLAETVLRSMSEGSRIPESIQISLGQDGVFRLEP
jgi:type VI secretion system protein VasG